MPFHWRLITLLAILALVATYETCVLRKTVRLKEYATLVACAAIFGLYGALNDVVTGTLSPEYFVLGKGIANDGYRFWRIIAVGASAGVSGGFILGALLLFVRSRCDSKISLPRLLSLAGIPLVMAVAMSIAFPLLFRHLRPLGIDDWETVIMGKTARSRFVLVWWTHVGAYFGAVLGTIGALSRICAQRAANSDNSNSIHNS